VLGALPRIQKHRRTRDAILMTSGLALLANSRPYEGLVLSVPVAVAMSIWLSRTKPVRRSVTRVVIPMIVLLSMFAVATGYYYARVTGSPFRMAYQVNRETYATAPYFLWQRPSPEPPYRHRVLRDVYRWELAQFEANRTVDGALRRTGDKLALLWRFYLGPALSLPLVAFPWILRDHRLRFALIALAVFVAGLAPQTWTFPHYFAPAAALLYLILLQCMRHMRLWKGRHSPEGIGIVRMIVVVCCAMSILRIFAVSTHTAIEPGWPQGNPGRAAVVRELRSWPGYQLVLVRYQPTYGVNHDADHEWIYNEADIDAAKIVWARDMGDAQNQELLRYFHDRKVWVLNGDQSPPRLEAFCCARPDN